MTTPNGTTLACDQPSAADGGLVTVVVSGVVKEATASTFTVDTCPPNADCPADTVTSFAVTAPDLSAAFLQRAFVRVEISLMRHQFGCRSALDVTSLASWGDVQNSQYPAGALLLAASDGGAPLDDSPYVAEHTGLPCPGDGGLCLGPRPGEYAFTFTAKGASKATATVYMGDTVPFALETAPHRGLFARNLRSYVSGFCDDFANFAYYIVSRPLPD